jgi:TldD protein
MRLCVTLKLFLLGVAASFLLAPSALIASPHRQEAAPQDDNDQTLRAMRDELHRSTSRLALQGLEKPFYIEYRLLDLDVRSVTASFGALISSTTNRNRLMSVDVRVGDYHFDSSNFIDDQGFQGFLGSTGEVGIDRDYHSLRQDLWLATDQAYKESLDQLARKRAFLRSLAKPPEIDDFSKEPPVQAVEPRIDPDWTNRDWDDEARAASKVFLDFSALFGTRVNYYLIYQTYYFMNSEGTVLRVSRHLAAIEASLDTHAEDGMSLHNFYSLYRATPSELPSAVEVGKQLAQSATTLMQLRTSPLMTDYTGPVLFDAPAAASLIAQAVGPSLSGARSPLSTLPMYDEMLSRFGARNEFTGRVGTRVFPTDVSLVDDPFATAFAGQDLIGGFGIDDEGVKAQKVPIVQNGNLRNLLMSRRPGPDFSESNGHARSALLSDAMPASSNLFFQVSDGVSYADLKKKFFDTCKQDGQQWCLEVKQMDNPTLASQNQQEFSDSIAAISDGIQSGDRLPLLVYKVYVDDGHEEMVRGGRLIGLTLRTLRNMAGIGNDSYVYNYMQNMTPGLAGTALGAFGSAEGGLPSSLVAPSLLLEDVEARGFHGEPRRSSIVPPPPLE